MAHPLQLRSLNKPKIAPDTLKRITSFTTLSFTPLSQRSSRSLQWPAGSRLKKRALLPASSHFRLRMCDLPDIMFCLVKRHKPKAICYIDSHPPDYLWLRLVLGRGWVFFVVVCFFVNSGFGVLNSRGYLHCFFFKKVERLSRKCVYS